MPAVNGAVNVNGAVTALEYGHYAATITQVGGALHSLTHAGRDLVVSWDLDRVRPFYRGCVIAPWPNRIRDGRYRFGGQIHQLPLTEPERLNALHGLTPWLPFDAVETGISDAALQARIWPQAGYPFCLDVVTSYRLDDGGLHWYITATNAGPEPAPYGATLHPYLIAGPGRVDDWTLLVPAASYLRADPERLLPLAVEPLPAELDFTAGRPIGATRIDHAYTGLTDRRVELRTAAGPGVGLAFTGEVDWLQLHTADRPEPELDRLGLAVEPMTCPPDAFTSGTDLVVLAPGESHTTGLRISALLS
jgi:aldose 1-epimerase